MTTFGKLDVNQKFTYKPFFGNAIVYKKIHEKTISGLKYNAQLIKPGLKQYEWFDPETPVRIER